MLRIHLTSNIKGIRLDVVMKRALRRLPGAGAGEGGEENLLGEDVVHGQVERTCPELPVYLRINAADEYKVSAEAQTDVLV